MWEDEALWATITILVVGCLCVSLSAVGTVAAVYYITGGM